jgi:hypothetical protein
VTFRLEHGSGPTAGATLTLLALGLVTILLAGCAGTVVDPVKTQTWLQFEIEEKTGTRIRSVDCPSGVEVIPGARFSCTVTAGDGVEALAEVEILNENADLRAVRLSNP